VELSLLNDTLPGILDVPRDQLHTWLQENGQPPMRARQVRRWILEAGAESFEQMTDLPKALRDQLISWFLSVQLFVLYSAFDHHLDLGSLPIMFIYGLLYFPKYWLPFGPRIPDWVCQWQWTNMIVVSHLKIAFWSRVGRWLLAMNPVYEEYTPERLKHALDPMPGEEDFPARGRHFTDSMV